MIARVWKGTTPAENADRYVAYLHRHIFPELRVLAGHRGAQILRRDHGGFTEFIVMTMWESLDAIRAFSGDDVESAVVSPGARELLATWDDRAAHYEIVTDM